MNYGLLLAAGKSKRFGTDKLFLRLGGKPVLLRALQLLQDAPEIDRIYIAANPGNGKKIGRLIAQHDSRKVKKIFPGGPTRFASLSRFFSHVRGPFRTSDKIIIHNGANPLATHEELVACFRELKNGVRGVGVGRPVQSTVKEIQPFREKSFVHRVRKTLPRQLLYEMETPQVVSARWFFEAVMKMKEAGYDYTDDLEVLEAAGMKTAIVEASTYNKKITYPQDFEALRAYVSDVPKDYVIGIGEDAHSFVSGVGNPAPTEQAAQMAKSKGKEKSAPECLFFGGVKFDNLPPLEANSDGDVILHALCNAISSALSEGSLGTYATQMCARGMTDSKEYVRHVLRKMKEKKFVLNQCAISVEAGRPRIDRSSPRIKNALSKLLGISPERVGITATTASKLTPFGRGEALRCMAIVSLKKSSSRPSCNEANPLLHHKGASL